MSDTMGGTHWLQSGYAYEFGSVKVRVGGSEDDAHTIVVCQVTTNLGVAEARFIVSNTLLTDTGLDVGNFISLMAKDAMAGEKPDIQFV